MCPTNSDEVQDHNPASDCVRIANADVQAICGVTIASIVRSARKDPKYRLRFCSATKGTIVWALAESGTTEETLLSVTSAPFVFSAPEEGSQKVKAEAAAKAEAFLTSLRILCHLDYTALDPLMPTWTDMVVRIARNLIKCYRFRGFADGRFPTDDKSLGDWKAEPANAYAWFKTVDLERRRTKVRRARTAAANDDMADTVSSIPTLPDDGTWLASNEQAVRIQQALGRAQEKLAGRDICVGEDDLMVDPRIVEELWEDDVDVYCWVMKGTRRKAVAQAEEVVADAKAALDEIYSSEFKVQMGEQKRRIAERALAL